MIIFTFFCFTSEACFSKSQNKYQRTFAKQNKKNKIIEYKNKIPKSELSAN